MTAPRTCLLAVLLAACAGGPRADDEPPPPDEAALEIETIVKARKVSFIVSDRLQKEMKIEAIRVERPAPARIVAKGSAVMVLRNLRVEASESIEVTLMSADHTDLLLYATEVALFQQRKGYTHKTENASAITMANDQVGYFQQ